MTKELERFLRRLWGQIVSPIVDVLQTSIPTQSRIWWCPTAEFSVLPLHAAGPYRTGQENLPQLYVSPYAPTLNALICVRRPFMCKPASFRNRFVAVGQANAVGQSQLVSVGIIGQHVNRFAEFTQIKGPESSVSRVVEELCKNFEWVHLACHDLANQTEPFESAFALHDGHFKIQRIIQSELENAESAHLFACHTTVGDKESPDEVIYLASATQFVGF